MREHLRKPTEGRIRLVRDYFIQLPRYFCETMQYGSGVSDERIAGFLANSIYSYITSISIIIDQEA